MKNISRSVVPAVALFFLGVSCSKESSTPISFSGSSKELKATEVLGTLDTPVPQDKNAIWCASFQAAWKALEQDLAGEPVELEGSPGAAKLLNEANDPRPQIPPELLSATAGWVSDGIIGRIQTDLKQKFPNKSPPSFPGVAPESFLAYAYVEASVVFPVPYSQNDKPLVFTDRRGKTTEVKSFGALAHDYAAYRKLATQPRILFHTGDARSTNEEFAIDLCSNSVPSQIVLARIKAERTLATTVQRVEKETALAASSAETNSEAMYLLRFLPGDSLLVPDLHWFISHHFAELEHRGLRNQKLRGQPLNIAQQDVFFSLNRKGARLKSEARVASSGLPTHFFFDRPFLIYMKKREATMPYFAMWVENAELLVPW